MVLDSVNQLLRVLESHAHGYSLGFNLYACVVQEVINVARRVSCGENYRAKEFPSVGTDHTIRFIVGYK